MYWDLSLNWIVTSIITLSFADDNLLVGTCQGHLLMYSVSCRYGDQKPEVQLLRYNKNFSKKPVKQLAVVPEYQLLISLSGNKSWSDNDYEFL